MTLDELMDISFAAVSTNLADFLYLGLSSEAISQILYSYSVLVVSSEQVMNNNFSILH